MGNEQDETKKSPSARQKSGEGATKKQRRVRPSGGKRAPSPSRLETAQQAVGIFLRATREAQKLTQEQVSAMTKGSPWQLSRAAISAIERGQNFPGMEAMLALSNVLYVDPKELIERARLSTVVPVDISDTSYEDLDRKASQYFWAGDFRKALSVYDAMLEKVALEAPEESEAIAGRVAMLEVRRATALKRAGAMLSAMATAERAISLAADSAETQARAYVVLAGLQGQRGHLPLARDAAHRAIELARETSDLKTQGWAWNVRAKVFYMSKMFEEAKQAFIESRRLAQQSGDHHHLTHTEGNIGICWWEQGHVGEARKWVVRAVERARQQAQPALEASWLVELGRIALQGDKVDEADSYAQASLAIAKPREHYLTIFRAEWLRHRVVQRTQPDNPDRHRLHYLRKLFLHLDQYEGIDEVQEFKKTAMRSLAAEERKRP
jgi:transcriptional regulator with XRE-family HTH domain